MKAIRIIALFLLGTVNAAFAQAVTTRVSDYSDIKCPQSFCDAFFDDQSVCEFTGTHALVYERDGVCGIEVIDAVVTCIVPCYALFANTDETKRAEAKDAPPEQERTMFILQIGCAVVLGAFVVGCAVWRCPVWIIAATKAKEEKPRPILARSLAKRLPPTRMEKGSGTMGLKYTSSIANASEADGNQVYQSSLSRNGNGNGRHTPPYWTSSLETDERQALSQNL